jgi:hypothetical protein
MMTVRCGNRIGLLLLMLCITGPGAALADPGVHITAVPSEIGIGALYDGVTLKVSGTVPAGSDVLLRFTGDPEELHLREKGKVFGLLWMNRNVVTFKNVPNVCLIQASRPFADLGAAAVPYRLEYMRGNVTVESAGGGPDFDAPHELLRLKAQQGLCSESVGGFTMDPKVNGMQSFASALELPSALAPGSYRVEAVALKDGTLSGQASVPVTARLVGLPAWLKDLAFQHGTLYGILACGIAILGGFLIGLLFQSKGAH